MSCISQFSKYILFLFNFITAVSGIILIVFGVLFCIDEGRAVAVYDGSFSLGGLAIGVGVIVFIIAFFGCCGAIKENTCMLTTYAIILIIIFVGQTVLAVLAFVKIQDEDEFSQYIYDLIWDLFKEQSESSIDTMNNIQARFECCGVNSYKDYSTDPNFQFPKSCCEDEVDPCIYPFKVGCAEAFKDAIEDNIVIIGSIAIGFAIIELAGAIFAFIIRKRTKEYV